MRSAFLAALLFSAGCDVDSLALNNPAQEALGADPAEDDSCEDPVEVGLCKDPWPETVDVCNPLRLRTAVRHLQDVLGPTIGNRDNDADCVAVINKIRVLAYKLQARKLGCEMWDGDAE